MDVYQILCLVGIPTMVTLVLTAVWNRAVTGTRKTVARREKEHIDGIRKVVHEETEEIKEDITEVKTEIKLISSGTQASLRNDLLTCYYKCLDKGYKTQDDAENFRDMYNAYHALGGNSFIDNDVVPSFDKLPLGFVEKENKKAKKKERLDEGK